MLKIEKVIEKTDTSLTLQIEAPLYWWADLSSVIQFSVPLAESIKDDLCEDFTLDNFSTDGLFEWSIVQLEKIIEVLNYYRGCYKEEDIVSTAPRDEYFQQILKLMPDCYKFHCVVNITIPMFMFLQRWFKGSPITEWGEFFKCVQKEIE